MTLINLSDQEIKSLPGW